MFGFDFASLAAAFSLFLATPSPPLPAVLVTVGSTTPRPVVTHPALRPIRLPSPASPVSYRNRLVGGGVNTSIGWYTDCATGDAPIPSSIAAIDACFHDRVLFVGHNYGVFTPLMGDGVGTVIVWWNDASQPRRMTVVGVRTVNRSAGVPPLMAGATVQMQTCVTSDGSVDRFLDLA